MRCAICGKTVKETGSLHRVNVRGETGVWACLPHGIQAINNLARARGADAVLEENRRFIAEDVEE